MDQTFVNICTKGKYYYPANEHYNNEGIVNCDRCRKTNLTDCFGYEDKDLCMQCHAIINISIGRDEDEGMCTLMEQEIFNNEDSDETLTFMEQEFFNK